MAVRAGEPTRLAALITTEFSNPDKLFLVHIGNAEAGPLYSAEMTARPYPAPDAPTDEVLMLAFAAGDLAAFDSLYARHRRGLYAFLARLLPYATHWVDDIFQDVWLNVARSRHRYRPEAQFRTWLYQIARNRTIDYLREHQPVLAAELIATGSPDEGDPLDRLPAPDLETPEDTLARKQRAQHLGRALTALPPVQREVFLLREQAEMSLEQIAKLTGVNAETAKSRLRYAIAKLRAALGGKLE